MLEIDLFRYTPSKTIVVHSPGYVFFLIHQFYNNIDMFITTPAAWIIRQEYDGDIMTVQLTFRF